MQFKINLLLFTLSCFALVGCGDRGEAGRRGEVEDRFTVGANLPMTGRLAFLGEPQEAALRIAAKELEEEYGISVDLIVEDNRGELAGAVSVAHKLVGFHDVDIGFVTTSSISNAVAPIFQESQKPIVTVCSDSSIARSNKYSTNFYVKIEDEVDAIVRFCRERGVQSISIFRVDVSVTERASDYLKGEGDGGINILSDDVYGLKQTDFKNVLHKIADKNPDLLLLIGYGPEFPTMLRQVEEVGLRCKVVGNYSMASAAARAEGVSIYRDVAFASFPVSYLDLLNSDFGKKFELLKGEQPAQFLDYLFAYTALKEAGRFWVEERGMFSSFSEYCRGNSFQSPVGRIEIDEDGNGSVLMGLSRYDEDGYIVPLK